MLRGLFLDKFDDLLAAWRDHDRLQRDRHVPLIDLAESRFRLDGLRQDTNRLRRSFSPNQKELESVLLTIFCRSFDETVFLYQSDADWSGGDPTFRCVCGTFIDAVAHQS